MLKVWRDPDLTLGERCVALCRSELARGAKSAPYGEPNTSTDVRMYLAGCMRDIDGDGDDDTLGLTVGNWCAAAQSWVLYACLLDGESPPHLWRAGVVEIVSDARKRGLYHPVLQVRSGVWTPRVGDLAIWDRSNPDKPTTNWWRHVNRVTEFDTRSTLRTDDDTFATIGGNEARAWRETTDRPKGLDHSKLLGFVEYPRDDMSHAAERVTPSHPLTELERKHLAAQVGLMLATMRDEALAATATDRERP